MLKKHKVKEKLVNIIRRIWPIIEKVLTIIIGSFLLAVAYNMLVVPYGLLSGGLTGIALLGNYLLNIPLPIGIIILNIPVFILGLRELNITFMLYSLLGTLTLAAALPFSEPIIPVPELDLFLAAIFSGVIGGIGSGIILRSGTSGGGADIIAIIAKKKWNTPVGACSFYFNLVVILMSLYFFELKIALYTIEQRYRDLDGQVIYNAAVEEILVKENRAVGVRLADGREYRADIIVSAADGYSTIFKLLGGRYVDDKIKKRYTEWELCSLS
jgi:hypothetical protein